VRYINIRFDLIGFTAVRNGRMTMYMHAGHVGMLNTTKECWAAEQ